MSIPLLSFFTGGGFLDMGFEDVGFEITWTNEINPAFADMYEFAVTGWRRDKGTYEPAQISARRSISDLTAETVIRQSFGQDRPEMLGVIGGPPCPDFSVGGRNKGQNGTTGALSKAFVDLICDIKPLFFVMENVPGLYKTRLHRSYFEELVMQLEEGSNYAIDVRIVSALELGAPQDRDRLFLIGFQRRFAESRFGATILRSQRGWFPWPEASHPSAKRLAWPQTNPFGSIPECPPHIPAELTVNPLLIEEPEKLPNGQEYFQPHSRTIQQRDEGDVSGKSFKRLHRYRYSPTVWYGNNEVHLHPWKPRRLSVREALRIQTLPDNYILPKGQTLTNKFKLISNGVPFLMAEKVACSVLKFIERGCE